MYLTCTRHIVKDYTTWRTAFDANVPMLEEAGVLSTTIVQVADNPSDIVVLNTWPAKDSWDMFMAAHKMSMDEMIKRREEAGVVGQPEFFMGRVV
ncbi:MAG: hypothetical protein KBD00_03650 [Candidatus Peribacteraceae bacterium]|nr:hypothetical protein [Candidatus Peribacteraceae bacterium]